MFKNYTDSYAWKILYFLTLLIIGFQSIFYPELTNKWFIQGLGVLWLIDAWEILIKIRVKYLKNKIKELENNLEKSNNRNSG